MVTDESLVEAVVDCDECGMPLAHGETNEYGHGTYCDHCSEGREEDPDCFETRRDQERGDS